MNERNRKPHAERPSVTNDWRTVEGFAVKQERFDTMLCKKPFNLWNPVVLKIQEKPNHRSTTVIEKRNRGQVNPEQLNWQRAVNCFHCSQYVPPQHFPPRNHLDFPRGSLFWRCNWSRNRKIWWNCMWLSFFLQARFFQYIGLHFANCRLRTPRKSFSSNFLRHGVVTGIAFCRFCSPSSQYSLDVIFLRYFSSKRLAPTWEELGDASTHKNVVIAKVDCTASGELCQKHEVPTSCHTF